MPDKSFQNYRDQLSKDNQKTQQELFDTFALDYSGVPREQIQQGSIEDIYRTMSKNLRVMNSQTIEQRMFMMRRPQNITALLRRVKERGDVNSLGKSYAEILANFNE